MAGEDNANSTRADAGAGGNVVYLGSAKAPAGGSIERLAPAAGDDTIGVSGEVLAFNRPPTMAFLDRADADGVSSSGSAAVTGGLGSLTLFGEPGLGQELMALPAGGDLLGYSFAFDPAAELAAGAAAADQVDPGAAAFQPASVAGGNALHLPDGTTVMLVDISRLTGSSTF